MVGPSAVTRPWHRRPPGGAASPRRRPAHAGAAASRGRRVLRSAAVLAPAAALALIAAAPAAADVSQTVTLEASQAVTRGAEDEARAAGSGRAELDLRSTGSRFVRGRLQLRALVATGDPTADLEVPRAFVKARFPLGEESYAHLTAGRARLTWGDGAFYNAGDTVFGALGTNPDLTGETIRDETTWLAAAFVPLGRFSFVEPVVLIPLPTETPDGTVEAAPAHDTSAGVRIQGKLGQIKSEASYLFRGTESYHQPAVSLQGNLFLDWYAGATTRVPGPDSQLPWDTGAETAREEAAASFGLLHIAQGSSGQSLTIRLEGLARPWKDWSERSAGAAAGNAGDGAVAAAAAGGAAEPYGLELFGEVIWQPAQSLQFYLRNVVSPIDTSALFVPGAAWTPYDGLTFSLFAALQAGEVSDVYGWERADGAAVVTTMGYVY